MSTLLTVENLHIAFHHDEQWVQAVRGIDFYLDAGEILALVGESGSGKSTTSKALMGLIPKASSQMIRGEVKYKGKDLGKLTEKELQRIRGSDMSMIFQDPMTALNPTMKVGRQIIEGLRKHQKLSRSKAYQRTIRLMEEVGISHPEKRFKQYPHAFSGGMRQRIMIAIAVSCHPKILIADEPTTALDVTVQSQVLELIKNLRKKWETSILLITHDFGVVSDMAERVAVMYGGRIVETGTVEEMFYNARHPYTWGLLSSIPKYSKSQEKMKPIPGNPANVDLLSGGCPFAPRCPYAMKICTLRMPEYTKLSRTQKTACWLLDSRAPKIDVSEAKVENTRMR